MITEEKIKTHNEMCAHCGDIQPGFHRSTRKNLKEFSALYPDSDASITYKDMSYVEDQCRKLAEQLKEME